MIKEIHSPHYLKSLDFFQIFILIVFNFYSIIYNIANKKECLC
jgi:hypothetical protein